MAVYAVMQLRAELMLFLSYMHPPDLANTLHVALIWSKEIGFTSVRNLYHYCHFIENRLCLPLMCIPTPLMQIPKHVCVLLSAAAHAIYAGFGLDSPSILFCFFLCLGLHALFVCVMVVKKTLTSGSGSRRGQADTGRLALGQ